MESTWVNNGEESYRMLRSKFSFAKISAYRCNYSLFEEGKKRLNTLQSRLLSTPI